MSLRINVRGPGRKERRKIAVSHFAAIYRVYRAAVTAHQALLRLMLTEASHLGSGIAQRNIAPVLRPIKLKCAGVFSRRIIASSHGIALERWLWQRKSLEISSAPWLWWRRASGELSSEASSVVHAGIRGAS